MPCPHEAALTREQTAHANTRQRLADAIRQATRWRRVAELIHAANQPPEETGD